MFLTTRFNPTLETNFREIIFIPIQTDKESRFTSCLEEMISQINFPEENTSLSAQRFVQKNIVTGSILSTKEDCLRALSQTRKEHLPAEKIDDVIRRWDKQKIRERKIEEVAQRVHTLSPFPLQEAKSLTRRAFSFQKGIIARENETRIVGRLNSGDVIIGQSESSPMSQGANVTVYGVTNFAATAEKVKDLVLKIQKYRSESGLSQEDELLNIAHGESPSPFIISPLEGRVIDRLSSNISEALQKKEGPDMVDFLNSIDSFSKIPSAEIIYRGVQEGRCRLREKNIIHLDNKLENLLISLDGQSVKIIDLDKAFLKTTIPQAITTTPQTTPMEGLFWIRMLLEAKHLLKMAQINPATVTKEEKIWLKDIKTILAKGRELKLDPLLEEEFNDTAKNIENFHDGLLFWKYINFTNGGNPEDNPFGKHFTPTTWFQKVVKSDGNVFPFLEPKNFESQTPEIKEAITKLLDPAPFLGIFNKAKLIDENFALRFKG